MPLVSIIIPTYNRERMIGKTIQSVLNQTNQDFEIIVVDDGSEDATKEVVDSFHSDKIQYYYQQNQGAQVARNYGLLKATGEYVCFLDSDDVWLPSFLEDMLIEFKNEDTSCVYCRLGYKKNGKIIPAENRQPLSGHIYKNALKQGYITQPSCLLVRRKCFDLVGNWDASFCASQDDDMCFRLAKEFKFSFVDKVLVIINYEYEGADNRIGASSVRVANGWWTLWNKFEKDVHNLCGRKIAAYHFLECVVCFIQAKMYEKGRAALEKAISCYESKQAFVDDFEKEIDDFIGDSPIFCYGAGDVGRTVGSFLQIRGVPIRAFIISKDRQDDSFLGYPLYNIDEVKENNCKIIISTVEKYQEEIESIIYNKSANIQVFKISRELLKYMEVILAEGNMD